MYGDKRDYLSSIEVFRDLSGQDIEEMERTTTMTTCQAGRIFYMPEETGEALFLLKKGRVSLYRISPDGKKLVVATLGPGAIFGELALIGQGMQATFAQAAEDCVLCVMSRADVERIIVSKPQVGLRFIETMGKRLKEIEDRLEDLAFKSIPAPLPDGERARQHPDASAHQQQRPQPEDALVEIAKVPQQPADAEQDQQRAPE